MRRSSATARLFPELENPLVRTAAEPEGDVLQRFDEGTVDKHVDVGEEFVGDLGAPMGV